MNASVPAKPRFWMFWRGERRAHARALQRFDRFSRDWAEPLFEAIVRELREKGHGGRLETAGEVFTERVRLEVWRGAIRPAQPAFLEIAASGRDELLALRQGGARRPLALPHPEGKRKRHPTPQAQVGAAVIDFVAETFAAPPSPEPLPRLAMSARRDPGGDRLK